MKKIIIQGDDWGYNEFSIAGIGHAYTYGILTETTIMANLLDPAKKSDYRQFFTQLENKSRLNKPPISFGIHLNLTYGHPITQSWPFHNMSRPFKGSNQPEEWQGSAWTKHFAGYDPKLIEKEFRAQIERVIDFFGSFDHLDSHHFIHSYSPIKEMVLKLAKEYGVPVRATAPLSEKPIYGGDFIVDENLQTEIKPLGIKTTDRCVLKLFWNEPNSLEAFLKAVEQAPDNLVTEFMVYPAQGDGAEEWRKKDLAMLTDPKTIQYFQDNSIQLVTYKMI